MTHTSMPSCFWLTNTGLSLLNCNYPSSTHCRMLQWLLYLLVIQNSCSAEIRGPADAFVPLSTETATQTLNSPGGSNVTSGEQLATDALKSSNPDEFNSHTITVSDFAKKTAAVNNERSEEQKVNGGSKNPSVVDLMQHPVAQQPSSHLPQDTLNPVTAKTDSHSYSEGFSEQKLASAVHENIQANDPLLLQSVVQSQEAKGTPTNTLGETSHPSTLSQVQHEVSSHTTTSTNQPASVSESSAQESAKMTVEEIIHPATGSQPQETSKMSQDISPPNNPITSSLQNPTTLPAVSSPQSVVESSILTKETSERNNPQQSLSLSITAENSLLPTSVTSPTASTMTVEEVTPHIRTDQPTSSDSREEHPQETTSPMNAARQQVLFAVGDGKETNNAHLDSTPEEVGGTSKEASAVKTEDKGGGISASSVEENVSTMLPLHSLEEIRQYSLTDFSNKLSHEIKQYRNNVSNAWESGKLISWTVEATSYLKDYMDAISISKSAHNSACVEKDLKNYEIRLKSLQDIVESCRTGLKRDDWNALQDKTSNVLLSFDQVVTNATNIISTLNKESGLYEVLKNAVEDHAKNSLCLIDTQSLRKSFSELSELSIRTDKDEYLKCIDSKPEKSMVKDTMSDIMRIKNNCVG